MSEVRRGPWGDPPAVQRAIIVADDPLFLWRGRRRLGVLHRRNDMLAASAARARARGELHAVLLPDPSWRANEDTSALASLWQRHRPFDKVGALMQLQNAAYDMAGRSADETVVSDANAWRDIEPDEAFKIGDANGNPLPFRTLSILEVRVQPGRELETLGSMPAAALVGGSLWTVSAFP